jgi:hypothetical protein
MLGSQIRRTSMARRCSSGLDGRCRDHSGEIRQKRADTKVSTLRETYGEDFAKGVSGNMHLGTLRDIKGESLSKIAKDK